MRGTAKSNGGYVLVSITAVLLAILAAILAVNESYSKKIVIDYNTNAVERSEVEKSAMAHLRAYAEQKSCTATPEDISVNGSKDGFNYTVSWEKSPSGTELTAVYESATDTSNTWQTTQSDIELYGATQEVTWVLAPYFSEYVEIKHNNKDHHKDHSDNDEAKVDKDKEMVLRSFKLGPLRTEPISLVQAELELTSDKNSDNDDAEHLQLNAIRYPWDPTDVTDSETGLGTNDNWIVADYSKFETLDTEITTSDNVTTVDFTGLLSSWLNGSRPNYGWAFTVSDKDISWLTNPEKTDFHARPRMQIKYRCACAEACVGIDQTEVAAIATLNPVDGIGGGNDSLTKLWLHRAHEDYLLDDTSSTAALGRPTYHQAGLSEFVVSGLNSGDSITGAHIEVANADHPDHHYYTLLDGLSVTQLPISSFFGTDYTDLSNANDKQLIYYQSPASSPVGTSLEYRRAPDPTTGFTASTHLVSDFVDSSGDFIGGFSFFDQSYWFPTVAWTFDKIESFPVENDTVSNNVHSKGTSTADDVENWIAINDLIHVVDALHVIDKDNYLISGEWMEGADGSTWETELGGWQFHDGEIVLYNAITEKVRIIDREVSRSQSNNVSAIALYKEPMPADGSSESEYEDAFPFMYDFF